MILSCGIVPIRKAGNHWQFLLLRCFRNWDFPKGMKDTDESPLEAARREFSEETGIGKIEIISEDLYIETEKYGQGKVARYYPGIVKDKSPVTLLPNPITGILEHQEYRWVSADEAHDMLVPRIQKVLAWTLKNLPE